MRNFVLAVVVSVSAACCHAQDAGPKTEAQDSPEVAAKKALESDLCTRKQNLINESDDLTSISKSLSGVDLDTASLINERAQQGMIYMDAIAWFLASYHRMQCDEDTNVAKTILQNRVKFYAYMLDMAVNQTNGYLGLARVPAVSQEGARISDELRAAKGKLDEISAALK